MRERSVISLDHVALGRAVRECRARHGIGQTPLSYAIDAHRLYVGRLERGECNPGFAVLVRLADRLDVLPSELMRLYERNKAQQAGLPFDALDQLPFARYWAGPTRG